VLATSWRALLSSELAAEMKMAGLGDMPTDRSEGLFYLTLKLVTRTGRQSSRNSPKIAESIPFQEIIAIASGMTSKVIEGEFQLVRVTYELIDRGARTSTDLPVLAGVAKAQPF
jgi:hypothetical protein